jgi:DNA-binding Lrp family transcriptional regulator
VIAAYILIQTRVGSAAAVTVALQDVPGVSESACLTGPYDVIARAQASNIDELARFVVAQVQCLPGVERTVTCPVVHL